MDLLIVSAIPFFFVLLGLEILSSRLAGRRDHQVEDIISDISCGFGELLTGAFSRAAVFSGYVLIYHQIAPFHMAENNWYTWIIGLIGVDFAYYCWHRFSHRTHLGWATHTPHHQSQDYNLAVALRQSSTSQFTIAPFYWPLAILGLPPVVLLVSASLNMIYQFWIHTRLIGRLGPLEWVLNTPSHHRVHHGIERKYRDRNYAGVLIIWDRLLGTFQEEEEEPTYGTVSPFPHWDPIWANLAHFFTIFRLIRGARSWRDRMQVWFKPPEWRPLALGGEQEPQAATGNRQDRTWRYRVLAPGTRAYALLWMALIVGCSIALLHIIERIPQGPALSIGGGILFTIWTTSGLLRGHRRGMLAELLRLVVLASLSATWVLEFQPGLGIAVLSLCLGSAIWLWRHEAWFRG